MNEKSYYLSIQSTSLAHYIGRALILPSRFYKNRPSDIQTIESDYLILSEEKFLNNSNCAIEIILNKEEIKGLKDTQNQKIFLHKYPIAISRIKKIFFSDEIQKLKTVDNIQRGEGFISQQLIEIVNEQNISVEIEIDNYKYNEELENKIKTYNHILGGLAFVRHTQDSQYSENYFSILSHFSKLIEEDYRKNNFKIDNKYKGAFTGIDTSTYKFWEQLYPLLYEDIIEQDVSTFSQKEDININRLNGVLNYETIKNSSITYKLAILSIYGENSTKRKKTNDLISDCKNEKIPKDKQEGIALIYGINNGYSTFRNQYDKKIVKFKMDSLLDYYTIESIFQYVINDKKDNERFEYIDNIGIEKEIILNKEYETYTILDETIVSDKKTIISKIKEWINERLFRELDIYIDNLFEKIKNLTTSKNQLSEQLNNKQREFETQYNELKNIQDKYNNETKLVEELRKNEAELKNQLNSKNTEMQDLTNSKIQLSEQLNNKQKELETQYNELKNIQDLTNSKIQLSEQVNQTEKEFKNKCKELNIKLEELSNNNTQLSQQVDKDNSLETFDEEKEKIIIEQFLELYDKNTTELKKIAKEKGIKSTKKRELIKDILCHKNNRVL